MREGRLPRPFALGEPAGPAAPPEGGIASDKFRLTAIRAAAEPDVSDAGETINLDGETLAFVTGDRPVGATNSNRSVRDRGSCALPGDIIFGGGDKVECFCCNVKGIAEGFVALLKLAANRLLLLLPYAPPPNNPVTFLNGEASMILVVLDPKLKETWRGRLASSLSPLVVC